MKENSIIVLVIFIFIQSCTQGKEQIVFSSSRNGNSDIFLMDFNGKNQKQLTYTEFEEWGPTWINGSEISFLRQMGDSIFRIKLNLKSNEEIKLEHPSSCILDDKNTLYLNELQLYTCNNEIFIFNSINNETTNLTNDLNGNANYPSWCFDGQGVVFTSDHLGTNEVFLYELNTRKIIQLTDSGSNNERGELSPNGKLLVYSSDYYEKGNQEIVLKNLETGKIKNVSKSSGIELIARFSKNGDRLYYGTNRDGNWEIYSYNLESEEQTRLTINKEFDGDPRILKIN